MSQPRESNSKKIKSKSISQFFRFTIILYIIFNVHLSLWYTFPYCTFYLHYTRAIFTTSRFYQIVEAYLTNAKKRRKEKRAEPSTWLADSLTHAAPLVGTCTRMQKRETESFASSTFVMYIQGGHRPATDPGTSGSWAYFNAKTSMTKLCIANSDIDEHEDKVLSKKLKHCIEKAHCQCNWQRIFSKVTLFYR